MNSNEKSTETLSHAFFCGCIPGIIRVLYVALWFVIASIVVVYVTTKIVPAIGMYLLAWAAIAEDAMLVTWIYGYIAPYLVILAFIVFGCVCVLRIFLRYMISWSDGIAKRIRLWYDKRHDG